MTASRKPVLQVRDLWIQNVQQHGSDNYVVSDVSLDVWPGETVCLVGESGSGKSVTSLAIMGLLSRDELKPCNGHIFVDDEDILCLKNSSSIRSLRASKMAMIFQEPMSALNPVERVGVQVAEVLKAHGIQNGHKRKRQVLQIFKDVNLPDPENNYDAYPHQLSGGQRQRVVISMALILRPSLLIADEPTTALDVTTQKQILLLIRELQSKQNTAVLFITHDFGVVSDIADRIIVLNQGRIVEIGSRDEILSNPQKQYTRTLVSAVPSLIPKTTSREVSANILTVSNLYKKFEKKRLIRKNSEAIAANNVSFGLNRGDNLGVVGESGSGKSTVARCIMRLLMPTAGNIELDGNNLVSAKGKGLHHIRQRIQMIFQDPYRSLNPRLRIRDVLFEGLKNYSIDLRESEQRINTLLEWVGIHKSALDRYPHQFSGGQRQRLCIVRALALKPDVLVADEAVSALDVSVQAQILKLLDELREQMGISIIFITHDLRVAAQVCNRILVMQKGVVVESGNVEEVLTQPTNAYTRTLIDAAPGRDWDFQNFCPASMVV